MRRTFTFISVFALVMTMLALPAASDELEQHCPGSNEGNAPAVPDGYELVSKTNVDDSFGKELTLPAGTYFCVKAGPLASGILLIDDVGDDNEDGTFTYDVGFLNPGGQVPNISNYLIYRVPTGSILIIKEGVVSATQQTYPFLAGATFTATKGASVHTLEEGPDGVHCIDDLPFGTYNIAETVAPPGWTGAVNLPDQIVSTSSTCAARLAMDPLVPDLTVTNSSAPGTVLIEKEDQDGNPMSGVRFDLAGPNAYADFCVTDVTGSCTIDDVPLGTGYILSETVPLGYTITSATVTTGEPPATTNYVLGTTTFDVGPGGQSFRFEVVNTWQGQWCSPGYWRQVHHLGSWEATGFGPGDSFYDALGYYPTRSNQGVRNGAPMDPTLWEVLQNPQWYGGDDFNAVGDLLSQAHPDVLFGDIRTEDSCPLGRAVVTDG